MNPADSPIEAYLDDLVRALTTSRPRQLRALVAETEAHLRDAAEAGIAAGHSPAEAESLAVARFGPAAELALAEVRTWRTPLSDVARQFAVTAVLLGAIAAIAVGISGLIAWVISAVSSARVLVDAPAANVLTASNCSRWLAADPHAADCRSAAMHDWVSDVVGYRLIAGVLGLLALAALMILRRRWRRGGGATIVLPAIMTDTIAAGAFTVSGLWLLAVGVDDVAIAHGHGSGQWLSAAPVALAAAAIFGVRLIRDLRSPAPR